MIMIVFLRTLARNRRAVFGLSTQSQSSISCDKAFCGSPIVNMVKLRLCSRCLHHQTSGISFWGSSKVTEWNKAVSEAEKIVGYPTSFMSLRCLLSDELSNVAMQMRKLVGTKHPLLKTARKLFYDDKHSMQTRGLLVLLVSKAAGPGKHTKNVLDSMVSGVYQSQRNLAEITEMINTASLIHKGVVDLSLLEPCDGTLSDMQFGNKMAVLSGDFLLANASTGLAELENTQVVELISSAIGDLMEAEFTALKDGQCLPMLPRDGATIEDWKEQTYLSSGSLISKSCKAAVILAQHGPELQEHAYNFGKHIAFMHQLNEDLLPFVRPDQDGVPVSLTSAPVVLHSVRYGNQLQGLPDNPAAQASRLLKLVERSAAVEDAKSLCRHYGRRAMDSLHHFPPSDARLALENMVKAVTS